MQIELLSVPPKPEPAELDAFLRFLAGKGWLKADAINLAHPDWSPRKIRAMAEAAGGRVISHTQTGYKLLDDSTPEEVRHALADLRGRARALLARYSATAKAFHQSIHPTTTTNP